MHLKKRIINIRKIKKTNLLITILLCVILFIYLAFKMINLKVVPTLINYAEMEIDRLTSILVGKIISDEINDSIDTSNMFIIVKDETGKIQTIDYDSQVVNRVLVAAVTTIRTNLNYLSQGKIDKISIDNTIEDLYDKYDKEKINKGIFYEVPFGVAFNNPFLANLGPKIPVKFTLIGDISSGLNTKITNYGINNAIIETSLNIKVKLMIILPINSRESEMEMTIPIVMKIIQGEIPKYYLNGYNQNSSILTLPVE